MEAESFLWESVSPLKVTLSLPLLSPFVEVWGNSFETWKLRLLASGGSRRRLGESTFSFLAFIGVIGLIVNSFDSGLSFSLSEE